MPGGKQWVSAVLNGSSAGPEIRGIRGKRGNHGIHGAHGRSPPNGSRRRAFCHPGDLPPCSLPFFRVFCVFRGSLLPFVRLLLISGFGFIRWRRRGAGGMGWLARAALFFSRHLKASFKNRSMVSLDFMRTYSHESRKQKTEIGWSYSILPTLANTKRSAHPCRVRVPPIALVCP